MKLLNALVFAGLFGAFLAIAIVSILSHENVNMVAGLFVGGVSSCAMSVANAISYDEEI